jgi:hypothetical protein
MSAQGIRAALERDGYVLIPRETAPAVTDGFVATGRSAMPDADSLVSYSVLAEFIAERMVPRINGALGIDYTHAKYRFSDNTNVSDAGAFHRDIIVLDEWRPLITALTYLDDAVMEVIPGSHRRLRMSLYEALVAKKARLRLRPGDVLVFYASLLHRGAFENTSVSDRRRLLQLFDGGTSPAMHAKHNARVMHVPGRPQYTSALARICRTRVGLALGGLVGYANAAAGYGPASTSFRRRIMDTFQVDVLASEGTQRRMTAAESAAGVGAQNVYVIVNPGASRVMEPEDEKTFDRELYVAPMVQYGALLACAIVAVCAAVFVLVGKMAALVGALGAGGGAEGAARLAGLVASMRGLSRART